MDLYNIIKRRYERLGDFHNSFCCYQQQNGEKMEKIKLSDLIGAGTVSVAQEVAIYIESFSSVAAFEGRSMDITDG